MSGYHCPRWIRNFSREEISNEGIDLIALYEANQCRSFRQSGTFWLDYDGEIIDSEQDEYSDPTCSSHDTECSWEDDPHGEIREELEDADFSICTDCNLVFPSDETYDDHMEEHTHPDRTNRPTHIPGTWASARNTHTYWSLHA